MMSGGGRQNWSKAVSSSTTEGADGSWGTIDDVNYPRRCDLCTGNQQMVQLQNRVEFAQHLRRVHSTREGGSFICRYGPNGVCQTLPLEGVSDVDYEAHIRKCHANVGSFDQSKTSLDKKLSTKSRSNFNVYSFTQNLSSVLLESKQSRSELHTFFTKYWGDSFVPKMRIPQSATLPLITADHFKKYLATTAKKHRHCLRAKKELRRALARHEENTRIDANDVPKILLDSNFSLADHQTFESIFLEPVMGTPDSLFVDGKPYTNFMELQRRDSGTSLSPSVSDETRSLHVIEPFEACRGRFFRSYDSLQSCLEFYHDLVDVRLNNQLSSKSNSFWKTVISCGSLSGELYDAINKVTQVRRNLQSVRENFHQRMTKVVELYKMRQQKEKTLQKLQDMACLRDAQLTVQMLLNQNDYPKALECIETAQEVLSNDLRGVVCFKHLGLQLHELHKMIAKMLYEEFVALIQKELGRCCENENDVLYQAGQLNSVIIGLMRVKEYRLVHVLQQEIVEAMKNVLRQIVKAYVVKSVNDSELGDIDPSFGNLNKQLRRLDFKQWFSALKHVLNVLFLMCRRVQSIQEVIIDNIEQFQSLALSERISSEAVESTDLNDNPASNSLGKVEQPCEASSITSQQKFTIETSAVHQKMFGDSLQAEAINQYTPESNNDNNSDSRLNETIYDNQIDADDHNFANIHVTSTPAASLSMPCRDSAQVKQSVSMLTEHAVFVAQERSCRLLIARSKDGLLERVTVEEFSNLMKSVNDFVTRSRSLISNDHNFPSPLRICISQQSSSYIKKFHEDRRTKLSHILDTGNWRASEVPDHFQRLVNNCIISGRLSDIQPPNIEQDEIICAPHLFVDGESYTVVGTALIVLQMMAQYCDALEILPEHASELLICVVELLKSFNSRSCQLILGAGALQLIGLKSISVRHLALSSRCLQLVLRFVPFVQSAFERQLPSEKKGQLRHLNQVVRDYNDHDQEITNKLISVIDHHMVSQLQLWDLKGSVPSPTFQQLCKQLGKFYNGLTGIMPEEMIKALFLRVHENFKQKLKEQLDSMGIRPYDSLTFGLVGQEYLFYIKSLQSMPCCMDMKDESIIEALFPRN